MEQGFLGEALIGRRVYTATQAAWTCCAPPERVAKLLVIVIDDREKVIDLAETARQNFPGLIVVACAWDRRHAYQLKDAGAALTEPRRLRPKRPSRRPRLRPTPRSCVNHLLAA
ncbi:MAG: hypothetical protein KY446_12010 [Proteobacteria bacterium]|nr:hypothetical protein [Pseudomonadota bacterium]